MSLRSWLVLLLATPSALLACDGGAAKQTDCASCGGLDEPIADWTKDVPSGQPGQGGAGGAAPTSPNPVNSFGQLKVEGQFIRGASGQLVQLKGVSSMWLNWENDGYAESLRSLEWMRDTWKVSVIRAAMGVAPSGAYLTHRDHALKQVDTIVRNAVEAGVYVIIDWHDHDALAHQAQAEEFFSNMAEKYGHLPNVIYETFNEPMNLPGTEVRATWRDLKPYHEAVVAKIREKDPDNIVILGTPNWSQDVDSVTRSRVDGKNLMYTLHFYSCSHGNVRGKGAAAVNQGLPLFVTEWGATDADGGVPDKGGKLGVCVDAAKGWFDWMDANAISSTAWKLDGCADLSCILKEGAPKDGPWTDEWLHGHGPLLRDYLQGTY